MSEFAEELADVLQSMVRSRVSSSNMHTISSWDEELWHTIKSQGFTDLDDPEVGLEEFAALAKVVGREAVGLPIIETGVATWISQIAEFQLNEDELTLVAFQSSLKGEENADGSLSLYGTLPRVPWGRHADALFAVVELAEDDALVLLQEIQPTSFGRNIAGEPRDDFNFSGHIILPGDHIRIEPHRPTEILLRGAVLRAAAASGAMERALELAVDYASEREQFGRPIARFQAVQHLIAEAAGAFAMTDAAVNQAITSQGEPQRLFAAVAKQVSSKKSDEFTRAIHQIFAAIGTTEEHPLQLLTRRLWSWQEECGATAFWSREIGQHLKAQDEANFWKLLTPPSGQQVKERFREVAIK